MEPPPYDEANLYPPPSYDASLTLTPPPTYAEAVTTQSDPFPVLTLAVLRAAVTSPSRNIIHPLVQVGAQPAAGSVVVVTQPEPVCILLTSLRGTPGLVCCPHCHYVVTTKVRRLPGKHACCRCCLVFFLGGICGQCLVPLFDHNQQDTRHSCPECGKHLHTFKR